MGLAEKLGRLIGQIAGTEIRSIDVEVEGAAAELNIKPITGAVLAGVMRTWSDTVNMVNAPFLAKERGIDVREIRTEREGDYHTLVAVTVGTDHGPSGVEGTLFGNRAPRLVELFGIPVEAELTGQMIYIVNDDQPGFIGALGTRLGENGSTSRPSISAAGKKAARRSPWSPSTIPSRRGGRRTATISRCSRGRCRSAYWRTTKRAPLVGAPFGRPACVRAGRAGDLSWRCCRRRQHRCELRQPCLSPSARTGRRCSRHWPPYRPHGVGIRFDLVSSGLSIRFDIVGRLLVRALLAGREGANAEGNRKDGGGLHLSLPCCDSSPGNRTYGTAIRLTSLFCSALINDSVALTRTSRPLGAARAAHRAGNQRG